MHPAGVLRQVHDCLAGRVAAADDHDLLVAAELGFHVGGGIVDPRALEGGEFREVELPVLDPAGHQHATGAEPGPVGEGDDSLAAVDPERPHRHRHGDPRAEPLRLQQRVPRELGTRDSGGEAEIVLDPRAGTGLATGRERVRREHVEPLGGGVHRGGEPGRAGAHHHQVVDVIVFQREREAGALGELGVRGLACPVAVAADHDRRGRWGHVELAQQRVGLLVGLEVDPAERDGVSEGEVAQPVRIGREARADDLDHRETLTQEQLAAHEERLEDLLADIGQLVHRAPELGGVHLQHAAVLGHAGVHDGRAAGEHVDVTGELAGSVHRDDARLAVGLLQDLDAAVEDDVEAEIAVAGLEEVLAAADAAGVAAGGERGQLLGLERGEGDLLFGSHDET